MWGGNRGRFMRGAGLFGLLFLLLACSGAFVLFGLGAALLGANIDTPRLLILFLALPLTIIAVILLLIFNLARGTLRPLAGLAEAADRVAHGDYGVRVDEGGLGQVRGLAHAFNAMAERIQTQDRLRRDLLADVTHELRTPLTILQGSLEGLLEGVYPRDDTRLQALLDETELMARLVDDLRILALSESGVLVLQKEPTDLTGLATETAAAFQGRAEAAGVSLTVETSPDLPTVELDAARIRQVLSNLIVNALRFTPSGGQIRLSCARTSEGVVFNVTDTGAGIPPEALPHIFERFYKSRDSGGTGLGLAIARNLVTAHGGSIHVQSAPGQGASIWFELPDPPVRPNG
jgi:signal transduction histidine kinase